MRAFTLLTSILLTCCASPSQTKPPAKAYSPSSLALTALAAAQAAGAAVPNDIWIQSSTGAAQENRPFTISRFFARGEIKECPAAVVGDTPVESQCDVKTRWDDGSVQHSMVSFRASVPAEGRLRVSFVNQERPAEGGLSREEMLQFVEGKWGAGIAAGAAVEDRSEPAYVNAKDILSRWNGRESDTGVRYWLRGPVATQVIVEDKSAASAFDFGWSSPFESVRNSTEIVRNSTSFQVYPDYATHIATWKPPLRVSINGELIGVCGVQGLTATICANGRGREGTQVKEHRVYLDIVPESGWRKAVEDRHRSLHPVFVLTFYRGWDGVKVEYVVENVSTTRLQYQAYNMHLARNDPPEYIGEPARVPHAPGSRWRKTFWSGREPGGVSIDYNLAHLVYSRALPSYDLTRTVGRKGIDEEVRAFLASDRGDIMGSAQWQKYFPAPGGRPDIAYVPRWYLRYLYTFDPELEKVMLGNAAAGAHVPIHFRESLPGRSYCAKSCAGPSPDALGRPLSLDARPTVNTLVNTLPEARAEDRMQYSGASSLNGWSYDVPHQSSFAYVPYLITGDWYFLEELYFWASFTLATGSPDPACSYCRNAELGWVPSEVRGRAWALRAIGHAAAMSPSGSPEREYYTRKLNNHVAIWEGAFDLRNGAFHEPCPAGAFNPLRTTPWCWGRNVAGGNQSNPLMIYEPIGGPYATSNMWTQEDFPKSPPSTTVPGGALVVYSGASEWMVYYNQIVVGHLLELGFKQLAELHAQSMTRRLLPQLRDPAYNPYLVAAYQTPGVVCAPKLDPAKNQYVCEPGAYITTWADMRRAFKVNNPTAFQGGHDADPEHGYAIVARAAASYLYPFSPGNMSGREAWDWLNGKINPSSFDENPMWALVPREIAAPLAAYRKKAAATPVAVSRPRKR